MTDERDRLRRSAAVRQALLLGLCALGLAAATLMVFAPAVRQQIAQAPWIAVLLGVFIVLSALGFLRTGGVTTPRPFDPSPEQDPSLAGVSLDDSGEDEHRDGSQDDRREDDSREDDD
ncbi:MAG: hypothetical protein AAGC60_25260 [Acidobacteriota bacterium]